jgi:hypothetical protein
MLFWKTPTGPAEVDPMERTMPVNPGEAWLYKHPAMNYCLGTSLCYWAKVWQNWRFPDIRPLPGKGEDRFWLREVNSQGFDSLAMKPPQMIATYHGGNCSTLIEEGSPNWSRALGWDDYCRSQLAD